MASVSRLDISTLNIMIRRQFNEQYVESVMKVAVLADGDPRRITENSGTPFHMLESLGEQFREIVVPEPNIRSIHKRIERAVKKYSRDFIRLDWFHGSARLAAASILKQLDTVKPDVVIVIMNSPLCAVLCDYYPTIHVSDATFELLKDYYSSFSTMSAINKSLGNVIEKKAITKSRACLYSSEWAANSAISHYGADASSVHFIPWGCNNAPLLSRSTDRGSRGECQLLYIGMDWTRKGGDLAVRTVNALVARGIPAHLHIVGSAPFEVGTKASMTYHGVLSKADAKDGAILTSLFATSSFLLLPTRQDCTPMVFAEANSYGIPVITCDTGGISSIVKAGENGFLLPETASEADYADLIASTWSQTTSYDALRKSSYEYYLNVLNWGTWAQSAAKVIREIAEVA
jgi:glycosyltransferase involved in cell wall biosynthesis